MTDEVANNHAERQFPDQSVTPSDKTQDSNKADTVTDDKAVIQLNSLPDEVLQTILQHLDAISLTSIAVASKRLLPIADEHLVWKKLCLRDFTHWDSAHEIESRKSDPTFHDWKGLYAVRHTAHVATAHSLRAIVDEPVGRLIRIQRVCDHGYGVKDTLLQLHQESSLTDCPLAQRYYTHIILSCLNRAQALETWTKIRYRSDIENPTELALAALDMFTIGSQPVGDIDDTFRRLDGYVSAIRSAYPDLDSKSPRTRAVAIAYYLREMKWVGIPEGADYYSIENQFLGYAVRSTHRNSLPLITCVIYSYICRAFDLRASPISYPNRVHAVVQPTDPTIDLDGNPLPSSHPTPNSTDLSRIPPSELTHLYLDPFLTHEPIPLSTLSTQLIFVASHATPAQRTNYLLPSNPRSLLLRTAQNIINSVNTMHPPPATPANPNPLNINDAAYAALFLLVLFPSTPASLASNLSELRQHFANNYPEDLKNYITYIAPLTSGIGNFAGRGDPLVKMLREKDVEPRSPKLRTGVVSDDEVKYRIGTVFRHRRQGYTGVVYGWDPRCEMNERWILGNQVDRLDGGRGQAFYNSFVDDGSSRYVAQENIIPLGAEEFGEGDFDGTFGVEIGKWFRRFDGVVGRFVSNVRDEYPED